MSTKQKRKPISKNKKKKKQFNKQLWSVILFSFGILVAMLTFVKGSALWLTLHNGLLGLFGISVYLVAPIMIYASIMIALDKSSNAVIAKVIEGFVLILLFCAVVQVVITGDFVGQNFGEKIKNLYTSGVEHKGGGLLSITIGYPLFALFNRVGASIIIILLSFTFIMLLSNITLIGLFKFFASPFTKSYKVMKVANEEKIISQKNLNLDKDKNVDLVKYYNASQKKLKKLR